MGIPSWDWDLGLHLHTREEGPKVGQVVSDPKWQLTGRRFVMIIKLLCQEGVTFPISC